MLFAFKIIALLFCVFTKNRYEFLLLSSDLKWNKHIANMSSRTKKVLGMLVKIFT